MVSSLAYLDRCAVWAISRHVFREISDFPRIFRKFFVRIGVWVLRASGWIDRLEVIVIDFNLVFCVFVFEVISCVFAIIPITVVEQCSIWSLDKGIFRQDLILERETFDFDSAHVALDGLGFEAEARSLRSWWARLPLEH